MCSAVRAEDVWAKSPADPDEAGESLRDHTARVLGNLEGLFERNPRLGAIARDDRLWHRAALAVLAHDLGKCAVGFQQMVRGGARFETRHEVLSCGLLRPILGPDPHDDFRWVAAAVLSHHRDLQEIALRYSPPDPVLQIADGLEHPYANLQADFFDLARAYWRNHLAPLGRPCALVLDAAALERDWDPGEARLAGWRWAREALDAYLRLSAELAESAFDSPLALACRFLRGLIILADHSGSARERFRGLAALGSVDSMRPQVTRGPFYRHQEAAAVDGHVILTAPTGSGKTEAALLWAARNGGSLPGAPLFYVLPYQASLNAMRLRLGRLFGDSHIVLQHGHATLALYRQLMNCGYEPATARRAAAHEANLARLHVAPLRVLTPYQLLKGAYQLPGHEAIWTDCAGGRLILDEMHAYEPERFGQILAVIRHLAGTLGARVLVMSATLPDVARVALAETLGAHASIAADAATCALFRRHRLHLVPQGLLDEATLADIEVRARAGEAVLVVATTVARAQALYRRVGARLPEARLELLHGRFCAEDRVAKEERVRGLVATGGPRHAGAPLVVVATQVVEVSLDLDFDTLYSDPGPLEALLQRFGRVNRARHHAERDVHVCRAIPDGCPVYDEALVDRATGELEPLDGGLLDEAALQGTLDAVYAGAVGERWLASVRSARDAFAGRVLSALKAFATDERIEDEFERQFDGEEVLPRTRLAEYERRSREDYLLAQMLLVPVGSRQLARLRRLRRVSRGDDRVLIADVPYSSEWGLDVAGELAQAI